MIQEADFYLNFTLESGPSYKLGVVVEMVDKDIESDQVWVDYEIVSVDDEENSNFKNYLSAIDVRQLEEDLLEAMWEDSEAHRVAAETANLEY